MTASVTLSASSSSSRSLLERHWTLPPSSSSSRVSSSSLRTTCVRCPTSAFASGARTLVVFGVARRTPRLYHETLGGGLPPVTRHSSFTLCPALPTWPAPQPLSKTLTGGSGKQTIGKVPVTPKICAAQSTIWWNFNSILIKTTANALIKFSAK